MKCPHPGCNGRIDTDIIVRHAESYGGSTSTVACGKCGKGVVVTSQVHVKLSAEKYIGPARQGTWGEDIPASN